MNIEENILTENICVRPMAEADLDRVCEIEEASFSMPWKKEDFAQLIYDSGSEYFVIEVDNYIVGAAGYTDQVGEGYINNVVIDEKFRGRGLSGTLMKKVLSAGIKKGITDFTLEVRVSNAPAVKLYESLGFESAGVRKRFYEHPLEDAYVMWLRSCEE